MKKTNRVCMTLLITILTGFSQFAIARQNIDTIPNTVNDPGTANEKKLALCATASSIAVLDINNVRAALLNGGDLWWNLNDAGYEVPKVDDPAQPAKHSLFAGAIWIGGIDPGGNLYVTAQRYRQGGQISYWPGPLDSLGTIDTAECLAWDRHFKINKDSIDVFRYKYQQGLITSANDIVDEVKFWPGKNNPYLLLIDPNFGATLNQNLAPFVDVNADGNYDPLDGDHPDIMGDQSIWWVINDAGGQKVGMEPENAAIGLEIQIEAFAFCASNALNNATFYSYKIINKGNITLNNTYIGQWVDPDIGQFDDDYVGCDVGRGMGYCYNGDNFDEGISGYGQNPPAIGIDFVTGILADPNDSIDNDRDGIVDEAGEQIIMSNFMYYNNNSDIVNGSTNKAIHYYNYLRSIWKDNTLCVYDGGDGVEGRPPDLIPNPVPCNFMFPGDTDPYGWGVGGSISNPIPMPVWTENTAGNTPADKRFIMSMGPVTLSPGSVNDFTIAVPWAKASSGGAIASVQKLQEADDVIQFMFDNNFVHYKGPAAPDVVVQSDSLEIILQLSPSPNYISILNGQPIQVNTTTYQEGSGSLIYTFQGYQVFQLADQYVTLVDLDDPDLALEAAQSDITDGMDTLSNLVWDFLSQSYTWEKMVNGANTGLQSTVSITTDAFTGAPLIPNKTYYYMVIAYASADPLVTDTPYVRGCGNAKVVSAAPIYPWNDPGDTLCNFGTNYFNTGLPVKRITGTGNMGRALELNDASIDSILTNNYVAEPVYRSRYAPVNVSVVDYTALSNNNFRLELSSYLAYENAAGTFNVGDTIINTGVFSVTPPNEINPFSYQILQKAGEAVIKRIVQDNGTNGIFDIEVINQQEGGTFVLEFDTVRTKPGDDGPVEVFVGYRTNPLPFVKKNDPGVTAIAIDYKANDYWKLINLNNNDTIYAQFRISEEIEEVISQYGISIQIVHANNPHYRIEDNRGNGFQEATITFSNTLKPWLEGVKNDEVGWLRQGGVVDEDNGFDPGKVYRGVLEGTWAPYTVVGPVTDSGAAYFNFQPINPLHLLNNVDIIITNDTSKWSRVPVLQVGHFCGTSKDQLRLLKSDNPSVDKENNPDNSISDYNNMPSTGMGWFPGYAIDLDKGIRLNIMFAEFVESDSITGDNLIWEPTSGIDGGRSYIYIMNSKYDGGKQLEYVFDSLIDNYLNPVSCFPQIFLTIGIQREVFYNCFWVGNPKLAAGHTLLETDVKIRLRVNRAYQAYGMDNTKANNPVYFFGESIGIGEIVQDSFPKVDFVIYPNPSRDIVYISMVAENANIRSLKLYHINGRLVRSQNVSGSKHCNSDATIFKIQRKGLVNGMYIYRITTNNDKTYTGKLIFE